jgi:hypothetical protein
MDLEKTKQLDPSKLGFFKLMSENSKKLMMPILSSTSSKEDASVGDSPEGPLKQPGESCLKPAKSKTIHRSSKRTHGRDPHCDGPRNPPERPTQRPPRAGSASLEGSRLPRAGSASLEGSRPPRAGSASLEGSSPPRSRLLRTRARSRTRVQAFNALTTAGRRHHAPGTHAPILLHQLPRGNPSPPLWEAVRRGRCQPRDTAPPTPVRLTCRALEGGPATPSNRFLVNL